MSIGAEELVIKENWVTTSFNPHVPCIYQVCHGSPTSEEFKATFNKVVEILEAKSKSYPHIQYLVDATQLTSVEYKDIDWASREGDMIFYNLGMRKIAFIIPSRGIFSKFFLSIYDFKSKHIPDNPMEHKFFYSMDTAVEWLKAK